MKRFSLVTRVWIGIFLIWGVFLSGLLTPWLQTPGLWQYSKLTTLRDQKKVELSQLEAKIEAKDQERIALESNPDLQEKEIRRVLGYVSPNEIVFDFSRK